MIIAHLTTAHMTIAHRTIAHTTIAHTTIAHTTIAHTMTSTIFPVLATRFFQQIHHQKFKAVPLFDRQFNEDFENGIDFEFSGSKLRDI